MSNQRLGEEKEEESSPFILLRPDQLVHTLRHVNVFLDFADSKDAGEHLLQLFFWDWLSGVPDGAVWSHHRLGSQVEGIVTTFSTLWTDRETEQCQHIIINLMSKLQF